ncbi:MAG: HDOD domain-containing protein [Fimbriimonadaceae bacterium]
MDLESLAIKIARSENLPVLPQVVSTVLRMVDDPNASPKSMERIIERDPAIAAKILRVANSPFYGFTQVTSINRAIGVLGMNTIRSLVTAIAYQQLITNRQGASKFDRLRFWQHSLAAGTAARILGKIRFPSQAEELYTAAMMHDVGILVLERFMPDMFDQTYRFAHDLGLALHQAEMQLMGFHHGHVGGLLAEKWGLTGVMAAAVRYHHDPDEDLNFPETTLLIGAANRLAYQCELGHADFDRSLDFTDAEREVLQMPDEQLIVIRTVVAQEVARAQEGLQIRAA